MIGVFKQSFPDLQSSAFTGSFPTRLSSSCRLPSVAESRVAAASSATLPAQKRKAHTSFGVRLNGARYLHPQAVVCHSRPKFLSSATTLPTTADLRMPQEHWVTS